MKNLSQHVSAYDGSSLYQFDNEIILRWYPERVLDKISASASLLELGLGHGFSARAFDGRIRSHHIVEGSQELIGMFRDSFPNSTATLHLSLFEDFEPPHPFDAIVMGFVLEHVENPLALLARYRKFLAPGGQLFVAVPNMFAMNRRLGMISGNILDPGSLSDYDIELGHRRLYSVEALSTSLTESGYMVKSLEGIFLKPLMTSQLKSLALDQSMIKALCVLGVEYPELSLGLLAQSSVA